MSPDFEQSAVLILMGTLEIGGSESKFVSLSRRLHAAGRNIHVGYLRGPFSLLRRLSDVPHVHFEQRGKWSLRAYRALRRYVHDNNIATIVTVNPYPLAYACFGTLKNKSSRASVVASINTSEILGRREQRFMRLYSILLRRCEHIVFGSRRQQELWVARYKLASTRSSVIYNGVDSQYFSPDSIRESRAEVRARIGIPQDEPVIVCVGQLRPEKAHVRLISAVAELNEAEKQSVHLLIVGDGAERDEIDQKIHETGADQFVHMAGSTDDVRPYLKAADLFALTSIAVETFSNAALEAAAMGLPLVMSNVGGASEMFPESENCLLYERDDQPALVIALRRQLERIQSGASKRDSLREIVKDRYSLESMDADWCRILWQKPTGQQANFQ
jgi:glycosyltransferase involved in cell wall biosynthesis